MHCIVTPTLKPAKNQASRALAYELLAQRITGYIEPSFINDDMLRGLDDEVEARRLYSHRYAPVHGCGLIIRDFGGFKIGYSPDGLVSDIGLIECKSRLGKLQIGTIITGCVPAEHMMQIQTGLLVSGREWCDYVSYSGGLPMARYRVEPDEDAVEAILEAAQAFEDFMKESEEIYHRRISTMKFLPTERRVEQEMVI